MRERGGEGREIHETVLKETELDLLSSLRCLGSSETHGRQDGKIGLRIDHSISIFVLEVP